MTSKILFGNTNLRGIDSVLIMTRKKIIDQKKKNWT